MAEFAASVVGLVGTVKTCIDLWDIIVTAGRLNHEVNHLVTHLATERIRFFLLCDITGFSDLALQVDNLVGPLALPNAKFGSMLLQQQLPSGVFNQFVDIIKKMKNSLEEAEKMVKKYSAGGKPMYLSILRRYKRKPSCMPLLEIAELSRISATERERPRKRTLSGLLWAVQGKQETTGLVAELHKYNDDFDNILRLIQTQEAARVRLWLETAAASTPFGEVLQEDQALQRSHPLSRNHMDLPLIILSLVAQNVGGLRGIDGDRGHEELLDDSGPLEANADEMPDGSQNERADQAPLFLDPNDRHLQLEETDITLQQSQNNDPIPLRDLGFCRQRPVIVEWRYYSTKLSNDGRALLENRVQLLAEQLMRCSKLSDFRVLPCLGCFYSEETRRYGVVFDYPSPTATPISLRDQLEADYRKKRKRDLSDRIRLAQTLCRSLYRFFSVGWLHKNVRSENVLLFGEIPDSYHIPEAYLAGFGFSRRNSARDATEQYPSVLKGRQSDREWQLYTHPRRQEILNKSSPVSGSSRATSSNTLFDVYGLGIILLEIALWCPVSWICSRDMEPYEFQRTIDNICEPKLRYLMGERYTKVVLGCLTGNFDEKLYGKGEGLDSENWTERRGFLQVFESLVVAELDMLAV